MEKYVYSEEGKSCLRYAPGLISMIRSEEYKLVYFMGKKTGQLFDLVKDFDERINCWGKQEYKDIQAELTSNLLDWIYSNLYKHRNLFKDHR